ncbi:hypothetical protein [Pseudomonas serbica]|uniref:hypothetical protein n=1 Tax=Pseudomonas serbica TaxID=2965074 RepID=UPI00237BBD15|nr:hypothetical protein [Pseudomonas serbica]
MQFKNFDERKSEVFRFRMATHFETMKDMLTAVDQCPSGFRHFIASGEYKVVSDVIDGNCVVIKRQMHVSNKEAYAAYFIDAQGHADRIRGGIEHEHNLEDQMAWLQSVEFTQNKLGHLLRCDLPHHQYDMTAEELEFEPGSAHEKLFNNFQAAFSQWCSAPQATPGPAFYAYTNESYSRAGGKSLSALKAELQTVYDAYPEYSAPEEGQGDFMGMVRLFAEDNFFNLHFVAKHYLLLSQELELANKQKPRTRDSEPGLEM